MHGFSNLLQRIPRLFEQRPGLRALGAWTWHLVAVMLVMTAPALLWRGQRIWRLPGIELAQPMLLGIAYLSLALFVSLAARRSGEFRWVSSVAATLVCFGAVLVLQLSRNDLPLSWGVHALGTAIGLAMVVLPHRAGRGTTRLALPVLIVIMILAGARDRLREGSDAMSTNQPRTLYSAQHPVVVRQFGDLVDRPLGGDGGAIARLDSDFLLVTGTGQFYRLRWTSDGAALHSTKLAATVPLERASFLQDHPDPAIAPRLRVTGLLVDTALNPPTAFVAHQRWNRPGRCFTMQVSAIPIDALLAGAPGERGSWRTVFESAPCLSWSATFDDIETGGRLARGPDGQLLLTTGDHGFDGRASPAVSQSGDNDYGKVLRLDGSGGRQILSLGHRNPQGLTVDRNGTIWSTEHGPQGGDEINVIAIGGNYGWPLVTYGTDYGLEYWPLAPKDSDHGRFVEPAHAFVPSVGIGNLIQLGGQQFPRWDGDLMVASLRGQSLFRVRARGHRVTYVEPIRLDHRIRDLAEGSDGRIVLWTDEGDVLSLSLGQRTPSGNAIFGRCRGCHDSVPGGAERTAPELARLVGRKVASLDGFAYSEALRRVGGVWTRERLDAFLADPSAFAPGSRMQQGGVADASERRALIKYLETMK